LALINALVENFWALPLCPITLFPLPPGRMLNRPG